MKTDILLESGTNELEILEFIVGNNHYGINVAKVKEILPCSRSHRFRIRILVLKECLCQEETL